MDPALFRCGESLLLLGEGNFSFARSLVQQNLPVDVTATCFESVTDLQVEAVKSLNIAFLTRKGL